MIREGPAFIGELQLQHDLASLADSGDGHLRERELAH
jgi:hypothetical protein